MVPRYGEHEIVLRTNKKYTNPYTQVSLNATLIGPTRTIRVNGFWDGGNLYKVRFLPTEAGVWEWTTSSNDPELDNQAGTFVCQGSSNRGYVRVSHSLPYTFEWAADRTPFFLMGDTIWHMYYNLRFLDGSFQSVVDDRAVQEFNYAHGVVHDFLHNEGGPIYSTQDPEREMFDTDRLNPSYFHFLDRKIDYMNSKGMVADCSSPGATRVTRSMKRRINTRDTPVISWLVTPPRTSSGSSSVSSRKPVNLVPFGRTTCEPFSQTIPTNIPSRSTP